MSPAPPADVRETFPLASHYVRNRPLQRVLKALAVLLATPTCVFVLRLVFGHRPGAVHANDVLFVGGFLAVSLLSWLAIFLRNAVVPGGHLSIDASVVHLRAGRRHQRFTRRNVAAGFRIDETHVLLRETNNRETYLALPGASARETIDRLFANLELDVGQRAIVVPLRQTLGGFIIGLLTFLVAQPAMFFLTWAVARSGFDGRWLGEVFVPLVVVAPLIVAIHAAWRFGSPRLTVGDDGVRVTRALRGGWFRYETLAEVSVEGAPESPIGVVLKKRDGTRRILRMYGQSAAQINGVARRISDSIARAGNTDSSLASSLDRGTRSIAEWRAWLRIKTHAAGGFRDVVFPSDALERVLVDHAATIEQRVGAALALRDLSALSPNLPFPVQTHIRVAAEASADPALRRALAAVAEDEIDDRDVETALAAARAKTR